MIIPVLEGEKIIYTLKTVAGKKTVRLEKLRSFNPRYHKGRSKTGDVEYFNCLGGTIINVAKHTREITASMAMAKAAFDREKTLFYQQIGLKFKEETTEVLYLNHRFV
jgi:hypothetical protein